MAHTTRLSDADLYARELFPKKHGYPLWMPEPYTNVDIVRDVGVSIGDVGYVTEDGAFQFLFNVRVGADHPINQFGVPNGFEPINISARDIVSSRFHMTGSVVASKFGTQKTVGGGIGTPENLPAHAGFETEWSWNSTHGAALHLPQGAHRIRCRQEIFRDYIFQHAESWYEFAAEQTHDVANDGLVLVTCCDKTNQWMVGAFSHESAGSSVSLYIGAMSLGEIGGSYSYAWGNAAVDPSWRQYPDVGRSNHSALPSTASGSSATISSGPISLLNDCSPEGQTHCIFFKGYRIGIRERVLTKDKRVTVSKLETQPPEWRKRSESQTFGSSGGFGSRVSNLFGSVWSKNKNKPRSDAIEPFQSKFPAAFSSPRPRPRPRPTSYISERSPPPTKTERIITAESFPYREVTCSPHTLAIQLLFDLNPTASVALVHDDDWLPFYDDSFSYPLLFKAEAPLFSRLSKNLKVAFFDFRIQNYSSRGAFTPRAIWMIAFAKVKFLRLLPKRPTAFRMYQSSSPRQIMGSNQRPGPSRLASSPEAPRGAIFHSERNAYGSRANARTTPCLYWAKGHCRFGDDCRFSHDLASSPRPQVSGDYKTRICWNWEQTGNCRYGNNCHFAHGPAELRQTRDLDSSICWDFAEGYCPRGETCRFIHEPPSPIRSHRLLHDEGATTATSDVPFSRFSSDIDTQSTLPTDIDRDSDFDVDIAPAGDGLRSKTSQHTLRGKISRISLRKKRSSQTMGSKLPRRQSFSEDSDEDNTPEAKPSESPSSPATLQHQSPVLPHGRRTKTNSQKRWNTVTENANSVFGELSDVDI